MKRIYIRGKFRWNNQELSKLKKNYNKSWKLLLFILKRSKSSITGKMRELKLYRGRTHFGKENHRYGKHLSEKTKKKQSQSIRKSKINHHKYGKYKNIIIKNLKRSEHSIIHFNLYRFIGEKYPRLIDEYFKWLYRNKLILNKVYKKSMRATINAIY